jgi:Ca-activated chloride channel homolog
MESWKFDYDGGWAFAALLWGGALLLLWWWRQQRDQPSHLLFSDVRSFAGAPRSLRQQLSFLPDGLKALAIALLLCALADPRILLQSASKPEGPRLEREEEDTQLIEVPTEGTALYLVIDRSSSMRREIKQGTLTLSRFDLLKRVTREFVRRRPQDLMGLVAFARTAHVLSPLTLDHSTIDTCLQQLTPASSPSEDGTAIGYALFKTVNLIAATRHFSELLSKERPPSYEIRTTAIVLVTDGFQSPHPDDSSHELRTMGLAEAAQQAANSEIRLYLINVEPMITSPELRAHVQEMKAAAESTGGHFYLASQGDKLDSIYREIDQLERSLLPQKRKIQAHLHRHCFARPGEAEWRTWALAPTLIGVGLFFTLLGVGLETTWLRRVP